jgi:hypothetical protein
MKGKWFDVTAKDISPTERLIIKIGDIMVGEQIETGVSALVSLLARFVIFQSANRREAQDVAKAVERIVHLCCRISRARWFGDCHRADTQVGQVQAYQRRETLGAAQQRHDGED